MYDVTAQGVDERMINVHYYYYYLDIITSIVNTSTGADDNNQKCVSIKMEEGSRVGDCEKDLSSAEWKR